MGTTFSVTLVSPPGNLDSLALQEQIEAELEAIEQSTSTYRPGSELSLFNATDSTEWHAVTPELCALLASALDVSRYTQGSFDITVGPLVNLWGFGPDGSISAPPDEAAVAAVRQDVGFAKLQTDCAQPAIRKGNARLYVDLSAYAKGYAVDRLAGILDERNLPNYIVEVGGELRMRGHNAKRESWAVAVERPKASGTAVQSVVRMTDSAVATSGDYRNFFEHEGVRYSHTIDPSTGSPVSHSVASVTVVADTAAFADAIATALLVLGPVDGMAFAERENIAAYFLLHAEDRIVESMTTKFGKTIHP